MPFAPKKPCAAAGCTALVSDGGYCERCKQVKKAKVSSYNRQRGSSCKLGYGRAWQRLRKQHLAQHPLCVECGGVATVCDHITPHRGDHVLLMSYDNLQSLCASCHSRKTAQSDGGFGNPLIE